MEFSFTDEQEVFRREVRDFLENELPQGWVGPILEEMWARDDYWAMHRSMAQKFGAKKWLSLTWPEKYGGLARSHMDQLILCDEIFYHRAPGLDGYGVKLLAPTLIQFGTDEQKKEHLGPIARGERFWCEGYSEPEAGSDLASVKTRAVRKGDHYVINGQKVWTTGAHRADWIFLLARTNPDAPKKHQGLSFFLADMKTPGITVRPILDTLGRPCPNEVFFEDVVVPQGNLVGGENNGWLVANALLGYERSGIEIVAANRRFFDDILGYSKETKVNGRLMIHDPVVRQKLGEMAIELEVARFMSYRVAWMQSRGQSPIAESAMAKVFLTEGMGHLAQVGRQLLGHYGILTEGSPWASLGGTVVEQSISAQTWQVLGGTSEILRTVVGTMGLGLPRS
ncbi:MAG: acyl-CoA dehydrogenase family protein [Dehalococcoidia bacterium]